MTFEMVLVPGGPVKPFYIGRTEVTWDLFDVFRFGLDKRADTPGVDAISRPSRPYGAPDYGWGHTGYPAISITRAAAEAFCKWLSAKTGKAYRLPTDAEWSHASALAVGKTRLTSERLGSLAWHGGNAGGRPHPVATKSADELGLFDLFGNASEWVTTADGQLILRGGSFRDPPAAVGAHARAVQDERWNERDPQLPKSSWWMSDAPFAGFRIVRDR